MNAGLFEDGPCRATGDDAGAGSRRLEKHATGTSLPDHRVGDRGSGQRHAEQVLPSLFRALLNSEGHLLGLAIAEPDASRAVADDHERGEREPAATLHDLGHAVDVDDSRLTKRRII